MVKRTKLKRILVALDESERTEDVLEVAGDVAANNDAELTLLRIVRPPSDYPSEVFSLSSEPLRAQLEKRALAQLKQLVNHVPAQVKVHVRTATGTPWRKICSVAQTHLMDLIIIGSHGFGGVDRVLGTTAAKVVNHAHCSVLVARNPELFHPE